MSNDNAKPVTLVTINPFKHEGKHYAEGEVLRDCDPELAKELTGAGRTRLATEEDLKKGKKSAQVEKTEA
jgi:hypothetical protein